MASCGSITNPNCKAYCDYCNCGVGIDKSKLDELGNHKKCPIKMIKTILKEKIKQKELSIKFHELNVERLKKEIITLNKKLKEK